MIKAQDKVDYFAGDEVPEIEVDECTFSKMDSGDVNKPVAWSGYIGIIRRGFPQTLKLIALPIRNTSERAPGPGPITKAMWTPIAHSIFKGKTAILHTDSARAYGMPLPGVTRTSVIHQLKKIDGVWKSPVFAETMYVTLVDGRRVKVQSGTQTIDGAWSHIRKALQHRHSSDPKTVDELLRVAQFRYWSSGHEPIEFFKKTLPSTLD